MTKNTANPSSRGLVSALRSDHIALRRAAVEIIDPVVAGEDRPARALMIAFNTSHVTAGAMLRERGRVTKSGMRKTGKAK